MNYWTYLTNFGYSKYMGPSLCEAKAAAVQAGFESVIYCGSTPVLSWSPVGGWRGLVASA